MAEDFPPSINRRRLLPSTAGITAAMRTIAKPIIAADAARTVDAAKAVPITLEAQGLKVCAATATRLLAIARSNEIAPMRACHFFDPERTLPDETA